MNVIHDLAVVGAWVMLIVLYAVVATCVAMAALLMIEEWSEDWLWQEEEDE